jgi:hypothetical protein
LLWSARLVDKFVGADLSTETKWKHTTIALPTSQEETKVELAFYSLS